MPHPLIAGLTFRITSGPSYNRCHSRVGRLLFQGSISTPDTPLLSIFLDETMKPIIHPEHVVHSTYPDVANIPDVDIYTFMFDRPACANYPPERSPDRIAFIDGASGLQITYSQL